MIRMLTAMGGEPWCYTPDQIATLTDWQIEHLYLKPAREAAEQLCRQTQPGAVMPTPSPVRGDRVLYADRETVVAHLMRVQGMTREQAETDYEMAARGTPRTG